MGEQPSGHCIRVFAGYERCGKVTLDSAGERLESGEHPWGKKTLPNGQDIPGGPRKVQMETGWGYG